MTWKTRPRCRALCPVCCRARPCWSSLTGCAPWRQRISIARALLKNAPIVLLDEATASLDVENETRVQGALSRLLQGKTVLVIAHRMRTVEAADHIVVLAEGKVAEEGRPEDLLQKDGGIFRRMTELQTASAAWSI